MRALIIKNAKWLSVTCLITCLLFLGIHIARADHSINNGTTVTINEGMVVFEYGSAAMLAGGDIDNQGTLIIKGNLVNLNVTPTDLGPGTVEFSGTTPQTITGQNIFGKLTLNNSFGLTILADQRVNSTMTLTSGLINLGTLGDKNLLLGPLASIGGSPSATAMVVATGTGELRKEFASLTSFTYPVGDADGTAEYSPVTANFTGGTLGTDNYLGVKLKNLPDPDPLIATGDYINRYWELSNNNITGSVSCDLTLNFLDADLAAGSKVNLYCVKTYPVLETYLQYSSGNQLKGTVTNFGPSFSRFTGARAGVTSNLNAFLEGASDGAGAMTTILPTFTIAYGSTDPFPLTQPYSVAPWGYPGSENVTVVPADVVDWVYIELRQASDPSLADASTIFGKRAAFLKSDGKIVDMDGISPVKFYNAPLTPGNSVYAVVKHRNHLAAMSNTGALKNGTGIYEYDFTDLESKTYGGPDGIKLVAGKWSLVGGNGAFDADINSSDYALSWDVQIGFFDGYFSGDFTMDGNVNSSDYALIWDTNIGRFSGIID
jgi:hypothetical protein